MAYAREIDVDFFSTAFDLPSVAFLEEVGISSYKVASADIANTPLLRELAATGKPVVVSTGGAAKADVDRAYETRPAPRFDGR